MFDVAASAYGRFMGPYSEQLADQFVELVESRSGQHALDVGCGPGALTARLAERLGPSAVAAVDPSPSFVAALRVRLPHVDVRESSAERLPFDDDAFDAALAQLVVHFMSDPVAGLQEMARVTKPDGRIAACVWDHAGDKGPLSPFWIALRRVEPKANDEADLPGARRGHLEELFERAGLREIESSTLSVSVEYQSFDEWWEPYTLGVGTAGAVVATMDRERRDALIDSCRSVLPPPPFVIDASAWAVRARP